MFWDGDTLTIVGAIRQLEPGVSEGSLRGAWTAGDTYFTNDIVSYAGQSWRCTSAQAQNYQHIATNNTNATTGYPGAGPWAIAAAAGTSGTAGSGGTSGSGGTAGTAGGPGPGVVYRGPWAQFESDGTTPKAYYRDPAEPALATRRDVVKGSNGQYYLCKVNHTTAVGSGGVSTKPITGVDYATYWESFGATFSSIATDILLAQDATITRGLVIGTDGLTDGFIRSTGPTGLETGASPGFYLQQDGKFRFGNNPGGTSPYIFWDNATLTIRGKIETDANTVSQIGDWEVVDGNFQHNSGQIVLDAGLKEIKISDSSNVPRVFMKQGLITVPAAATSINVQAQNSYDFGVFLSPYTISGGGSINVVQETLDTIGVSVTTPGTYTITTPNFGSDAIAVETDANFVSGYISAYVAMECWNNPTRSGTILLNYALAVGADAYGPEEVQYSSINTAPISIEFPTAGTYYFHTVSYVYGFIPYTAEALVYGQITPDQITLSLALDQTEIGRDGMIVLTNQNNYASIKRTTSAPIVDIKTNGGATTPGIRIANTATGADVRAIEVLDGDIYCSGVGNNIRVNLGWIGTDYTADGIRMGTDGNKSILILQDPPAYNPIGGDAGRLRPNQTALGITGYRLTYDSSTRRYKTEIEEYPSSAYDSIKKLKPILFVPKDGENMEGSGSYDYTNTFSFENPREYMGKMPGFLAEDLDEHPELRKFLNYEQEETPIPRSVHYDRLTVLLTKAVQTLMEKVENLEAYISSSKI
jgi:hypothetical protein